MGVGVHGNDKIIGVIPARFDSSRLPGKPLKKIKGYPMIYWVAKQVKKSNLKKFIVATDNIKIYETCNFYNIPVKMTSSECKNGTERVAEISKDYDEDVWFVNIQGDEPLINPLAINKLLIEKRTSNRFQFIQAVNLIDDLNLIEDVNTVKVLFSENKYIQTYSRKPVQSKHDKNFYRCLGLYLYSKKFLNKFVALKPSRRERSQNIEQLRALDNDLKIKICLVEDDGFSVDTMDDLKKNEKIIFKTYQLGE